MTKRWLLLLLIACIPLAACGDNGENGNNGGTPPETTNNYAIEDGSLIDPETVSIGRVETVGPAWVVVFEGTSLLGHTRVEHGESTDIRVDLDVSLSGGPHTLEAILYADEGAESLFEVPGSDRPILENGELVSTVFEVSVDSQFEPAISAEDQTLATAEAGTVDIASATARDDAWVVVRSGACADSADAAGAVRGFQPIARGQNTEIVVDVTPEVSDGETLCAYLHDDDPKDGEFMYGDGGQEDLPVSIEGTLVADEFVVTVEGAAGDPVVEASDQDVDGTAPDTVTVDRVVSEGAGWIVIRRGSCSDLGEIVGQSSVTDGENTDVSVDFDQDEWILGETAEFCGVLHTDDPADDAFTFDGANGEDEAVRSEGGDRIFDGFTVTVTLPETPALVVSDQLLTEPQVVVDSVYVPEGRWLALYTDDGQGGRDSMIGFSEIAPTPQDDVTIDINSTLLGRAIEDGETFHVAVHTDAPNDEDFTPGGGDDPPATDDQGDEFSGAVVVTVPSLTVGDQTVDPATDVVVDAVRSAGTGWLAAYDGACPDTGASWGTRLGFVAVTDGESTDVTLSVDSALTDQQTICVALHRDDPADDTFNNTDPANSPDAVETRPMGDIVQAELTVTVP